jgi:hypothetical protein
MTRARFPCTAATLALGLCASLTACTPAGPVATGTVWPEADLLFRRDPLWIGGDGAYSCPLGPDTLGRPRVLWLFGDSLVAKDSSRSRDAAWFVRNSVGIQTGADPSTAAIAFHWGRRDGHPGSFFPEDSNRWFWPGACARVGQGLVVFGQWLVQETPGMWGFGADGSAAWYIADADADPSAWHPSAASLPALPHDLILGTAGSVRDGWLYVYGARGDTHDYGLVRFPTADASHGDLTRGERFTSHGWASSGEPANVLSLGAPESSVHFEPRLGRWVMIQGEGFGASTLALRDASAPEGPWSEPRTFLRPPESFTAGAFVYAGKGHPELLGADLVVTYVPSAFDDPPRKDNPDGYFPHFVRMSWP